MQATHTHSKYLKANITLPKITGVDYFKSKEHRVTYEKLIDTIWRAFIKRLQNPIKIRKSKHSHQVEVLGITRYYINNRTHKVTSSLYQCVFQEDGWHFSFKRANDIFMVDPPLLCSKFFITTFVNQWLTDIDHLADIYCADHPELNILPTDCVEFIQTNISHAIHTAIRLSTHWKLFRQDLFNALQLNPEIVRLARLCRLSLKERNLTEINFNHVCTHLTTYRQLYLDAPNLVWLYRAALEESIITKQSSNPIHDLKKALLATGCGPRSWRLLVNARQSHFDQVIKSNNDRWYYLTEYLHLHERLDRRNALSPKLASLFDHPNWSIPLDKNLINYRDVSFQAGLFNKFINETFYRQSIGESTLFVENEVTPVLTWLASTNIRFDTNQLRQPWSWFAKKAVCWFAEQLAFDQLIKQTWNCGLTEVELSGYRFTPLNNAWQIRLEALNKRHCVDQYIHRCQRGEYRVFKVQSLKNKTSYTLGLRLYDDWEVDQIKAFGNRPASDSMFWLCQSIAEALNLLEDGGLKEIKAQWRNTLAQLESSEFDLNSLFQLKLYSDPKEAP